MQRLAVAALALVVVVTGCISTTGIRDAEPTTATTATPTTSGSRPPASGAATTSTVDTTECHIGSSPAIYDASSGDYATFLVSINTSARTLTFDVVQWLVGNDAVSAYHKDQPNDPNGPPNDYYIVNASSRTFSASVSPAVRVRLVRLHETAEAGLKPGTFAELPTYLAGYRSPEMPHYLSTSAFWLTIEQGQIVDICEQYRP